MASEVTQPSDEHRQRAAQIWIHLVTGAMCEESLPGYVKYVRADHPATVADDRRFTESLTALAPVDGQGDCGCESYICKHWEDEVSALVAGYRATAELRGQAVMAERAAKECEALLMPEPHSCHRCLTLRAVAFTIRSLSPDPFFKTKLERDVWERAIKIVKHEIVNDRYPVSALIAVRDEGDTEESGLPQSSVKD